MRMEKCAVLLETGKKRLKDEISSEQRKPWRITAL